MPEAKEIIYQDIPLSFSAHPITGKLNVLKNADAVKNSVKLLVLTNFYERPYNPSLGGNITTYLFENIDSFTEYSVAKSIRIVLKNYEPRAIVDDVIVKAQPDSNILKATIIFRVKNDSRPQTVSVLLERVR